MFEHRIEHREQFSHTRGEGDLLGFARAGEPLIEGARITGLRRGGDNRIHVPHGPDLCAPAPHRPPSAQCPTIPVERGHADQCGDLLMGQGTQFREIGEPRGGQHGADARDAAQQLLFFALDWTPANGRGQGRFDRRYESADSCGLPAAR